jgi:hypothetical protein
MICQLHCLRRLEQVLSIIGFVVLIVVLLVFVDNTGCADIFF